MSRLDCRFGGGVYRRVGGLDCRFGGLGLHRHRLECRVGRLGLHRRGRSLNLGYLLPFVKVDRLEREISVETSVGLASTRLVEIPTATVYIYWIYLEALTLTNVLQSRRTQLKRWAVFQNREGTQSDKTHRERGSIYKKEDRGEEPEERSRAHGKFVSGTKKKKKKEEE